MKTAEGSPSRFAMVRSSYVGFLTAPSTWSMTTRTSDISRSSDELLRGEEVGERLGARAVLVLDDLAGGARRAGRGLDDLGPRGVRADLTGVDTQVAQRPGLEGLLLGRHDPLEGRVAGLAGLVGDREDQRHGAADDLGGGVAVALDADLVALELDDRGQRHLRQAEALGEHRRDDAHAGVGRREATDDEVDWGLGTDLLYRLGEHQRGRDRVRAGDGVVYHVDALVGTHLQRLADGVERLLRANAESGHRGVVAGLLLDLQRLLDAVLVELRQQTVDADAVHGVVRLELPVGSGVGDVLHTDDNVHGGVAGTAPPVSDFEARRERS